MISEPLAAALWQQYGIPKPLREFRFHPTKRWRFDYAWPGSFLALEVNGGTWRAGGGAHRGRGAIRDYEKWSEAAVLGWRILHLTPEQFERGEALGLVKRALAWPHPADARAAESARS